MSHFTVVGAGFGGIASALRMRALGHEVTLIDRLAGPGGRAQVFERNGYRFDAGPTVITAPFLFDELFALFGENRSDYLEFVPLSPWYRFYFSEDGSTFDYGGTVNDTLDAIAELSSVDVQGYLELVEHSKNVYDVGFTQLAAKPFDHISTMVKQVPNLVKLRCHETVWQMVSRFLQHPKLRQAFSIQPLLVGGNPFDTTSIYGLIHFLEREHGIHFCMGGTAEIVKQLSALMDRVGIEQRYEYWVKQFHWQGNAITAIENDVGERLTTDQVIFNGDPSFLYRQLVPESKQRLTARLKTRHSRFSMGLYVLFFGTKRTYDDVAHHTIWLGKRYQGLLTDIFDKQVLAEDFSLYVHRPTATDPSFAPEGCDSFYVLAPVPNLQADIDWQQQEKKYREKIIQALDATMLPGLSEAITEAFAMTPEDFEFSYQSTHGAGFSIAPTLTQSAWFRYHNKAEGPKNLYLCGAGTHPGAGMPGVLCSAKVVEQLVVEGQPHARELIPNEPVAAVK